MSVDIIEYICIKNEAVNECDDVAKTMNVHDKHGMYGIISVNNLYSFAVHEFPQLLVVYFVVFF